MTVKFEHQSENEAAITRRLVQVIAENVQLARRVQSYDPGSFIIRWADGCEFTVTVEQTDGREAT